MTDLATLNSLRLPALLREVAEIAGIPAALRLAQAKGGTRVYVPRRLPADHWLVEIIGMEAASALQRRYSGEKIDIPLGIGGSMQNARAIARQALDGGASVAQAALAAGLTERGVYKLMSREERKVSDRQLRLFED